MGDREGEVRRPLDHPGEGDRADPLLRPEEVVVKEGEVLEDHRDAWY